MIIKRLPTGMLASNCYIVGDNGEGIIIDPGADSEEILDSVRETGLKVKYIMLTHPHIDHILSVDKIREILNVKVLIHEDDANALASSWHNGSKLFGLENTFNDADILLKDGDVIEAGGLKFEIMHTPGHTPGGICIKVGNNIFTGDTLFRMSIGRTDLGTGDHDDIMDSLVNKLMKLEDDIVVHPGHGTTTTIGYERKFNPYI